jgi:hypothetical protein
MEWRYKMDDEDELHPQSRLDEDNYYYDADYAPRQPRVRRRIAGEWDELSLMDSLVWKSIGIDD